VLSLKQRLSEEPHQWLEMRCSAHHRNSPFFPVIGVLQKLFGISGDDGTDAGLGKLESALASFGHAVADAVPVFAAFLSIPLAGRYPAPDVPPPLLRRRFVAGFVELLDRIASRQPVVSLAEDLHWADPSTLELLEALIEGLGPHPLLLLLSSRSALPPPWSFLDHTDRISLARLQPLEIVALVRGMTGGRSLPAEILDQIVEKTDGVPLFVEELTKMVLESGLVEARNGHYELTGSLPALAIPSTLHDSLMARLDRLGTAKERAQLAAVIGREFSYELLSAVAPVDETALRNDLGALTDAGLLYQTESPPKAGYGFKHALIQEVAYASLLKSTRRQWHERVARVLEQGFAETIQMQPELLAHHWTEAGLLEQAASNWLKAAQVAIERSANDEAIAHSTKGIELVRQLPESTATHLEELRFQTILGSALVATKGYGAEEARTVYERARDLSRDVAGTHEVFPALYGLLPAYLARGELQSATEIGEKLLAVAKAARDSGLELVIGFAHGMTLYYAGNLVSAREHFERGIAIYDPEKHASLRSHYIFDPGIGCRRSLAAVLWLLGYPDQALEQSVQAVALAERSSHPYGLAAALTFAAILHHQRREPSEAEAYAERAASLSAEKGFAWWLMWASILRDASRVERAWLAGTLDEMKSFQSSLAEEIARYRATGARSLLSYWLALDAEARLRAGSLEAALKRLDDATAVVEATGERFWEAEIYRLRAEVLLRMGPETEAVAEAAFHRAVLTADRQGARSLLLRAVIGLARLLNRRGHSAEARETIIAVHAWFREGYETEDLRSAQQTLAELG